MSSWIYVEIHDVCGNTHTGDKVRSDDPELPPDFRAQYKEFLTNFSRLSHLSLEVSGRTTYFNPQNIVWVQLCEDQIP